jgi:hypothetical protein
VRVEAEHAVSAECCTGGPYEREQEGVRQGRRGVYVAYGADGGVGVGAGEGLDSSDDRGPTNHRVEDRVVRTTLGPGVHLLPVLLVDEHDRDEVGQVNVPGLTTDDPSVPGPKDDELEGEDARLAGSGSHGMFARAYGEEVGADQEIGGVVVKWLAGESGLCILVEGHEGSRLFGGSSPGRHC